MDKGGKAKEMTLGGLVILIIAGALFLSVSNSDQTGIISSTGIILVNYWRHCRINCTHYEILLDDNLKKPKQ